MCTFRERDTPSRTPLDELESAWPGYWWPAEDKTTRYQGVLSLEEPAPQLDIFADYPTDAPAIVHGRVGECGRVTLAGLGGRVTGVPPRSGGPNPFGRVRWHPSRVVLGEWLTEDSLVSAVDVHITRLDDWLLQSGNTTILAAGVPVVGGVVRLLPAHRTLTYPHASHGIQVHYQKQRLRFEFDEAQTLEQAHLKAVAPLEALLSVIQLQPASAEHVRTHVSEGDRLACPPLCAGFETLGLSVWRTQSGTEFARSKPSQQTWALFDCSTRTLTRWFELHDRCSPAVGSLTRLMERGSNPRQTFQSLAACLEGLVKGIWALPRYDFVPALKRASEALQPMSAALPMRTDKSQLQVWADLRNDLTHSNEDSLRGLDVDIVFETANRTLFMLCIGLVGRYLGLDSFAFGHAFAEVRFASEHGPLLDVFFPSDTFGKNWKNDFPTQ